MQLNENLNWIIWRQGIKVMFKSCSNIEAKCLECLQAGFSFTELCETLCEVLSENEVPAFASNFILKLVATGVLVHI